MALERQLVAAIEEAGPMPVSAFMAACLYDPHHGYYVTRPAIGGEGDFLTAPEASQMFGELIGAWGGAVWQAMGAPSPLCWVELGPGNGTLTGDAWRAFQAAPGLREAARLHFIEINEGLKLRQRQTLAKLGAEITHCQTLADTLEAPTLLIANEFFDCLPIRQFVRGAQGAVWHEKLLGLDPAGTGALCFGLGPALTPDQIPTYQNDPPLAGAPAGAVWEYAPGLAVQIGAIAARLTAQPGAALIIDYGSAQAGFGDTLQAIRAHQKVDPLHQPGAADLTAHVDFSAIAALARAYGLGVWGPVGQGAFLRTLGLDARAEALARANPQRAERIARQHARLTAPDQMGVLFQVICLTSPSLPPPAGFVSP
jgi:NADH dehydrogenase [ubiquinone] 1 alpha subcomplex assembly factor 7